jgi:hypothetical protein
VSHRELVGANCQQFAEALTQRPIEGLPFAHEALEIFAKLRSLQLAKAEETLGQCEDALQRPGMEARQS